MANVLGIQTVNNVEVLEVDSDPSLGLGTPAPVGTLALANDGSGTYYKFGALDTDWSKSIFSNTLTYGSFYDTTTQTVASGDVKAMEFNTTDATCTNGFSITNNTLGRPTRITATKTGVYNLQFSAQLNRLTGGQPKQVDIWIAVNGVPVPNTSTGLNVQANAQKLVAAWNFYLKLNSGQYVEIIWTQDDEIEILYQGASGVIPVDTPSVIATINQIG